MDFAEQQPSKQWAALKHRGETAAEVWFKPDGDPLALTFRVPQGIFDVPGMAQRLTAGGLLRSVGVAAEEVESWRPAGAGEGEPGLDLGSPLPQPGEGEPHLLLHVRLRSQGGGEAEPEAALAAGGAAGGDIPEERWQVLESRWGAILALEASIDTLRISMESLRSELEGAARGTLSPDEKVHAPNADLAVLNKAKTRALHSVPKAKEFIHRSTWVAGAPERKRLEELFKTHVRPRVPFPEVEQVLEQLESLLKDRQVLSAHGTAVYQDCKGAAGDVQAALRTLKANAASAAARKRGADNARGKRL